MKISIITPSFNMLPFLKTCSASIADQEGVSYEHIVIDGGSTDGTTDWLAKQKSITWVSEKDNGMYDAVNKGLNMAKGDIIAYLNCDEQYLPGTLRHVKNYFEKRNDVDVIFGDMLLINEDGGLIAYRKSFIPRLVYIYSSFLYTYSCTMFFRRKVIDDGLRFNSKRKAIADAEFVIDMIRKGYTIQHIPRYVSAFAKTENNLGASREAASELQSLQNSAPFIIRVFKKPLRIIRFIEKLLRGNYFQNGRIEYSIYANSVLERRQQFTVKKSSFLWKN